MCGADGRGLADDLGARGGLVLGGDRVPGRLPTAEVRDDRDSVVYRDSLRFRGGRPIEAISQQRSIDVPATLIPARFQDQVTALQVVGDSMIDDGILEDDYVIIRRQEHAENGQTVVALLGGSEATIKKYYRKSGRIELHSANTKYQPIIVDGSSDRAEGFRIAGVLVALFRKF